MNKTQIIREAAHQAGLTLHVTEKALNAVLRTVTTALKNGEKVRLIGFGTFETRMRKPRLARNISTGAQIQLPATVVPVFKAGETLKRYIKN